MKLHHFILTRFNLPLWTEDKHGHRIDRKAWLDERLDLFEKYCLPSIKNQSCKDFTWILLCDEDTPVEYRSRIKSYIDQCPQIELIQVEKEYAWDFPQIFAEVVTSKLEELGAQEGDFCITTYLDNDDALHKDYVKIVESFVLPGNSFCFPFNPNQPFFFSFDYGLQYFTDLNIATRVKYPNNHFMTCVEKVSIFPIRTCYGYGSHFLLEKKGCVPVYHIKDKMNLMWCEVIHENNVDNDVKMTLDTHIIKDVDFIREKYGINSALQVSRNVLAQRVLGQVVRRCKEKIFPRKWK